MLERLVDDTRGDNVSLGQALDVVADRSFGPLLLVVALIAVGPTAAIPLMSYVATSLVIVLSAQMLVGRKSPWIPGELAQFEFLRDTLERFVEVAQPYAEHLDAVVGKRLTILVNEPARQLVAGLCTLLALMIFPLDILPLASGLPGLAIGVFGLGLTMRDGLVIAIGLGLSALAVWFVIWLV